MVSNYDSVKKISTIGEVMKDLVIEMNIKIKRNVKKPDQRSDLVKNRSGITVVRCPHLRTCRFGEKQSKQARIRCRGLLCQVNHWEACLVISFKCPWLRKRIMVEVKGNDIRHIPRNSSEHQEVQPRLEQLFCQECKHWVLDYNVVYGDAIIDMKCRRDGHLSSHPIK